MDYTIAYYNGRFGYAKDIKIPLSDRSIYFGDAVYDAALCLDGRIYLVEEHIDRFLANAARLKISHSYAKRDIKDILENCLKMAGNGVFFMYFQLSRNAPERKHDYTHSDGANFLVTVSKTEMPNPKKCISLITCEDTRHLHCDIKTVNLLVSVMASTDAALADADEAVFHRGDTVTECAHSNISIIKDEILYTHPLPPLILPGITRRHLLICCDELGIKYIERPFTLSELFSADEILVSSTTKLCVRGTRIDGVPFGNKNPQISMLLCNRIFDKFVHFN